MKIYKHHAILHEENYKGINFQIVLINAGWFTCYLDVTNTRLAFLNYMSIEHNVHGGLTYSDDHYPYEKKETGNFDKWIIGWDYAHFGDAVETDLVFDIFKTDIKQYHPFEYGKHHTVEELILDCKTEIDNILEEGDK